MTRGRRGGAAAPLTRPARRPHRYAARHRLPRAYHARLRLTALRYRLLPQIATACAVGVLLCAVMTKEPLPVPGRLNVRAVVTNIIPTIPALAIMAADGRIGEREIVSARGRPRVLGVLVLGVAVLLIPTCALAWALGVPTFVRNILLLAATGIGLAPLTGPRAAGMLVIFGVMANWLLGIEHDGVAYWWAWVMATVDDALAGTGALALTGVATLTIWLRPRAVDDEE